MCVTRRTRTFINSSRPFIVLVKVVCLTKVDPLRVVDACSLRREGPYVSGVCDTRRTSRVDDLPSGVPGTLSNRTFQGGRDSSSDQETTPLSPLPFPIVLCFPVFLCPLSVLFFLCGVRHSTLDVTEEKSMGLYTTDPYSTSIDFLTFVFWGFYG